MRRKLEENEPLEGLLVKNVKARLQNHLGDSLSFWSPPGKSEIVFKEKAVFEPSQKFFEKVSERKIDEIIVEAAKDIRNEIINYQSPFSNWPPTSQELVDESSNNLPELVTTFLTNVLTYRGQTSDNTMRIVNSLGQDLVYNCTHGKTKTKKHCQLGILVKRKTGKLVMLVLQVKSFSTLKNCCFAQNIYLLSKS